MRTDSNSVLSLASNAPVKASKSSLSPTESGVAFQDSLEDAKSVLDTAIKPVNSDVDTPENSGKALVTESSVDSSLADIETTKEGDVDSSALAQKTNTTDVNAEDEIKLAVDKSGNVLQLHGDQSPKNALPFKYSASSYVGESVSVENTSSNLNASSTSGLIELTEDSLLHSGKNTSESQTPLLKDAASEAIDDLAVKQAILSGRVFPIESASTSIAESLDVLNEESLNLSAVSELSAADIDVQSSTEKVFISDGADAQLPFDMEGVAVDAQLPFDMKGVAADTQSPFDMKSVAAQELDTSVESEQMAKVAGIIDSNDLMVALTSKEVDVSGENLSHVIKSENSNLALSGEAETALTYMSALNLKGVEPTDFEGVNSEAQLLGGEGVVPLNSSFNNIPEEAVELSANDELSWVLSQMNTSNSKNAPLNTDVEGASLETSKVTDAVSAALLANSMNRNGRAETQIAGLNLDGLSSEAIEGLNLDEVDMVGMEDALLADEPIELRKKELELLMGRMSAQMDGKSIDEDVAGGFNSSVQSGAITRSALGAGLATGAPAANQPANMTMSLPPNHPGWATEMSQKVAWVARDGGHMAHIRLDPPELGSLTVKVSVDSDSNTQISFVAATPQARDLLEGQMGRLREMLAQQGMDLSRADVDVSQRDASGAQEQLSQENNSGRGSSFDSQDELDDELITNNMSYVSATGVDYYA